MLPSFSFRIIVPITTMGTLAVNKQVGFTKKGAANPSSKALAAAWDPEYIEGGSIESSF